MASPELFLLSAFRVIVEVAMLALIGQGILALLAGSKRGDNLVYKLFLTVTGPVMRVMRFVSPKIILDRHLPFVGFFVLFWLWIALAYAKREICVAANIVCQ